MPKGKLEKFAEVNSFSNVIQPNIKHIVQTDHELKGNWHKLFRNNNPIVLELGCGKGEYSIALANLNPDFNYIGIDIKGARIWRGAKTALEQNIKNVRFLRIRIDLINSFFDENEVDEIWITFPDPQPKKQSKRLSSARFLNLYRNFLKPNGIIHLKTDSQLLHFYTKEVIKINNINPIISSDDLYSSELPDEILNVKTFYEKQFLKEGKKITYLKFKLSGDFELKDAEKFNQNTF